MVSSVTSACHLGCVQRPSIPFHCSSFASTSLCATHIAVPGVVIFPQNLLCKLWCISGAGFGGSFPSANVHPFWLFCLLVSRLVYSESRLIQHSSGQWSNDLELGSLFQCWLPALGSFGEGVLLTSSGVLGRLRLGGVLGSPSIGWYCRGSGRNSGSNVTG
jgi:hypothetical protein